MRLVATAAIAVAIAALSLTASATQIAPVSKAQAQLAAMPPAELARFVERCKRRMAAKQDPAAAPAEPAAPSDPTAAAPAEPAAPASTASRDPESSLRTWTDVINGGYDNGGPGVDMCVLAITERGMNEGWMHVLNAEAATAATAIQEVPKAKFTTNGKDITYVAQMRKEGTAKLGVVPGEAYKRSITEGEPPYFPAPKTATPAAPAAAAEPAAAAAEAEAAAAEPAAAEPAAAEPAAAEPAAAEPAPVSLLQLLVGAGAASRMMHAARAMQDPADANPVPDGHMRLEPMPGMNAEPVDILALTNINGNLPATAHYGVMHSYVEDLGVLVKELQDSEAKARKLRLLIVEKDNFLEGLQKRERLLRVDMTAHKQTLAALAAHIQAVEARIGRLKEEHQLADIAAQKLQMDSAASKLSVEQTNIRAVASALNNRIQTLDAGAKSNLQAELESMRRSVQPLVAAGYQRDDAAADASAAAIGGTVESFLQTTAVPALGKPKTALASKAAPALGKPKTATASKTVGLRAHRVAHH